MTAIDQPLWPTDNLVVCFGRTMDRLCTHAITEIARRYPEFRLQFAMSEWLTIDQFAKALVFWVMDPSAGMADIAPALQYGIPLLVPESCSTLKQACIEGNYGLFYQDKTEAMACLTYLAGNPNVRNHLAKNASSSKYRLAMAGVR